RSFGQTKGQFVYGSEVMKGSRQHLKAHRHSLWGAYQVQPPPEEAPLLGCTLAEVGPTVRSRAVNLATPPRSHILAYRYGQAVDDEGLPLGKHLPHHLHNILQQLGKGVQPPAEAGDSQGFGDVAHPLHDEQGALMVVWV